MTTKKIMDGSGKTLKVIEVEGRLYPEFSLDSIHNVFNFKARPDDIVLCTYPKSGTHWGFEVIRLLLAGTTDLPKVEKDDTMIEDAAPASIEALPSPRNLNTHFHYETLSPEFFKQKCKMIYITRDPRDVEVSYFNHHKKLSEYYEYEGEFKDHFQLYLSGQVDYDSWFDYTKGWEKGMKENPNHPFLVLSFEAMKRDPLSEVTKVAEFLDVKCTEDFLKEVVVKTSFDSMKAQRHPDEAFTKVMYRKGQVGDWKNWFTVAQSEIFNEVFEKEMPGTNAYKLYSHTVQCQADANMNAV